MGSVGILGAMPRVLFRLSAPPPAPGATLFLTGTHRDWSSEPQGWTFSPDGMLAAELPEGALLNVKVRALTPDGTVTTGTGGVVIAADKKSVSVQFPGNITATRGSTRKA